MIHDTSDLAVRATIFVALQSNQRVKPGLAEIASELSVPEGITNEILRHLKEAEIIDSEHRSSEKFVIRTDHPTILILSTITSSIEGDEVHDGCGFGIHPCKRESACHLHESFVDVRSKIHDIIQETPIPHINNIK